MKKKFLVMFLMMGVVFPMSLILSACDVHSHTYDGWSYDQTIHWKECTDCGEQAEIGSHTVEEDWSMDSESHWKGCSVCGYKQEESAHEYDNNCDTTCNICGYIRTAPHTFDNDCDTTCNDCDFVREIEHIYGDVWSSNETIHWKDCTICGEKLEIAHEYDNNCDVDCNVCGYVRTAPHTFDDDCDTTCNDCDYTREIEHSYKQTYSYDEDYHWHECERCGSVQDGKTSHEYYGDCDTTCNICGAERKITHTYNTSHFCTKCGSSPYIAFVYDEETQGWEVSTSYPDTISVSVIPSFYIDEERGSHPVTKLTNFGGSNITNVTIPDSV